MGLENGIVVKSKTKEDIRKPPWVRKIFSFDKDNNFDICYWRRWWGFRSEIINSLKCDEFAELLEKGHCTLTLENLKAIRKMIIKSTFSKRVHQEYCRGYWDYNYYTIRGGVQYIINLTWAIHNFDKYNFYFYDSF